MFTELRGELNPSARDLEVASFDGCPTKSPTKGKLVLERCKVGLPGLGEEGHKEVVDSVAVRGKVIFKLLDFSTIGKRTMNQGPSF